MSLQNKNVLGEKFYERFSKIYKAFYSFGLIPKEICQIMCKLLDIKDSSYYKYLKQCREMNKINTTFKGERDRMVKRMNNNEPIKADEDIRDIVARALSDELKDKCDEQISMFTDGPKGPTTNSVDVPTFTGYNIEKEDDCPVVKITEDQILEVAKTSATSGIPGSGYQDPGIMIRPLISFDFNKNHYIAINAENSCTFANINFKDTTKPRLYPYFKGSKMSEKYFKKEILKFTNQIKQYLKSEYGRWGYLNSYNDTEYFILRLIKGDGSKEMTSKKIDSDIYLYNIPFNDFSKINEKIEIAITEVESSISPSYLKMCVIPLVVVDGLHNTSQLKQLTEFSKDKIINIMPVMKLNRTIEYLLSEILINKNMKIDDIEQYKDNFKKIETAIKYGNKVFVGVGDGEIDVSSEIELYDERQ